MVPEGWRKRSLVDVAHIQTGIAKGKKHKVDTVMMPYLRVANVQDGYLNLDEIKEIEVAIKDVERFRLKAGDIVLTEGGDFDKLGRGTIWRGQIEVCLHQNHVFAVRVDETKLLPEFFSAQTNSHYGKAYFLSCAKRSTNLASINSTQLKQFPALVPPLPEQRKIADILSTWDQAIEKTEALLSTARTQKRALMQQLLTGNRRFPEFEGQPWKEVRLGDVARIVTGSTPSTTKPEYYGGDVPFVSPADLAGQNQLTSALKTLTSEGAAVSRLVPEGTILFSCIGQIGKIVKTGMEVATNQQINAVIPDDTADADFVFYQLQRLAPRVALLAAHNVIPIINKTEFSLTKICMPAVEEQSAIAEVLNNQNGLIEELVGQITKLRTEKKALMQQLLTGKRRVVV